MELFPFQYHRGVPSLPTADFISVYRGSVDAGEVRAILVTLRMPDNLSILHIQLVLALPNNSLYDLPAVNDLIFAPAEAQ